MHDWLTPLNPCRWCLCATRWKEAEKAGHGPQIDLEATDEAALRSIDIELLKKYAGGST